MTIRSEPRRRDIVLDPWSHVRVVLFCSGVGVFLAGAARDPTWVETVWLPWVGAPWIGWAAWLTGWVPFAVAEIVVGVLAVWAVFSTLSGASDVAAGRRGVGNALASFGLHTASTAALFAVWFQLAWGLAYQRAPLGERWALPVAAQVGASEAEVTALRARLASVVDRVNASYRAIHGVDDAGWATRPREGLSVDAALESGFQALGHVEDLGPIGAGRRPPAKAVLVPDVFGWLGIGGVFVPFTGEATFNGAPPGWAVAATMAHEKAHQRFVAPEDEATFVGVLAGLSSREALLRYAAWMTVRGQLERTLYRVDAERAQAERGRLLPGVVRDLEAARDYWAAFEGPLEDVAQAMNDSYLKANGVEDGVVAYGRAARLIDAWLQTPRGKRALSGR